MHAHITEIDCSDVAAPTNGSVRYSTTAPYQYRATITYSCDTGYGLLGGDTVRACISSSTGPGEWSGTAPTCEGKYLLYSRVGR